MKYPIRAGLVPALACLLSSCTTLYVKTDVNTALAASVHCGTYAWAGSFHGNSALRSTIANPINENRLRSAIAAHLGAGAMQTDASKADCLVGYGIGSNQVVDPGFYYPYGGWGWGPWGPWGPGWDGPYVYREGVIAVDVYDAKSGQPLWHASVDQNLYGVSGPEAQKRIDAAVAAIFAKYPYHG
jgi:Domain of unknown function (DUF4136)